jgi:hypothetical protein
VVGLQHRVCMGGGEGVGGTKVDVLSSIEGIDSRQEK